MYHIYYKSIQTLYDDNIYVDNIVILLNSLYIVTRLQLDKVVTWLKTCQFQGYHKVLAR